MENIKTLVELGMRGNVGRGITVKSIREFIDVANNEADIQQCKDHEIRQCLTQVMGYSWRKANVRPPRSLRSGIEADRSLFHEFKSKLKKAEFTIVYIDEGSFNSSALPLYSWMRKGEPPAKVIRNTDKRYNAIAAKWHKYVYFEIKEETSTESIFARFLENVIDEIMKTITKSQFTKRTVFVFDNAYIHKGDVVKSLIKKHELVIFTIPPYSPEGNQIEHCFGTLKKAIANRNLSSIDFLYVIGEEITKLK